MQKLPNWRERFANFIVEMQAHNNASEVTFAWDPDQEDALNCLQFASKAVEAQTGIDLYTELAKGAVYDGPISALKVLRSLGYPSLDQLIGSLFNRVPVIEAKMGDLVIIPARDLPEDHPLNGAVAVCAPPFFYTISSEKGFARGKIIDLARMNAQMVNARVRAYAVGDPVAGGPLNGHVVPLRGDI